MKKQIEVFDYSNLIMKELKKGILVTTASENTVNPMTISWGKLGIEWGKTIFVVYIRKSRYTKELLDKSGEFTINVPIDDTAKKTLGFCGTKSGRDINKVETLGLTLEEGEKVDVPGIKELPLTLECKVIYKQDQDPNAISEDDIAKFYPEDINGSFHGANRDFHTAYYGEIINSYIIKD